MTRFKSAGQAQLFLWVHDQVANLFRCPANTNSADHRKARAQAFTSWANVTGIAAACRSDGPARALSQLFKLPMPPRLLSTETPAPVNTKIFIGHLNPNPT
jgi:hypothetical protein